MSEELGKYSLKFAGNTYTSNEAGDVTIHQNWEGTADGYGTVFGTLIWGPTPPNAHVAKTSLLINISDGTQVRSEGEMALESLEWNGTMYSA